MATVMMIGTLDTKQVELKFLRDSLEAAGVQVVHLDPSVRRTVAGAEIGPDAIATAAGTTMEDVRALKHEGKCIAEMIRGATKAALEHHARQPLSGIIALGGSMGTALAAAVMREFPYGLPKVIISTMASGFTKPYVGVRDITMMNSVCDVSGINTISRDIFRNGALAVAGMALGYQPAPKGAAAKPLVLITTLGTTEKCSARIRDTLEAQGFEVMVFHSNGSGGATLDQIVRERPVAAVVDLSLIEIMDFINGGLCAGPADRAKPAADKGVPLFLVPGNVDFIVGGPLEDAQQRFPGRRYHVHNPALTAVRTNESDYVKFADHLSALLADARGPVSVHVPLGGLSAHDSPEGHLYDLTQPPILARELRRALPGSIPVIEEKMHINDAAFADLLAARVLQLAVRSAA